VNDAPAIRPPGGLTRTGRGADGGGGAAVVAKEPEMAEQDHGHEPSLPETERRERETEGTADDAGTALSAAERRARGAAEDADTGAPSSLPGAEHREREAEADADAGQEGRTPSLPETERRTRQAQED
jgi:hypothetical protein